MKRSYHMIPSVFILTSILLLPTYTVSQENTYQISRNTDSHIIEVSTEIVPPPLKGPPGAIEVVVINPFRSANVAPQVGGLILSIHYDEGDFVEKGQVVCELDETRYKLVVDRARERLNELRVAEERTEEEAQIKQELLDLDVTTRLEDAKARAEFEMAEFRVAQAAKELDMAKFDFDACKVRAPFSGYISSRQKQPHESVDKLQTIFSIVDSSKVYAVAHVPVAMLQRFPKGAEAEFVYGIDNRARGVVDRIAKLIDPKSKTKRVYLLIDNSAGNLEVGMTGSLQMVN